MINYQQCISTICKIPTVVYENHHDGEIRRINTYSNIFTIQYLKHYKHLRSILGI